MAGPHRFWNMIARRYARMPVRDEAAYREKLRLAQSYFQPDWEVLEIGCGTGSTALEHAPHVAQIRAVDSAEAMIAICREKAAAAKVDNVRFELGSFDTLDVPDGSLDAVLAMSILHLLDDPRDAIARVFAMLRPGGMFLSSTICLADMSAHGGSSGFVIRRVLPLGAALGLLPRMQCLHRADLRGAMQDAGFDIEHELHPDDDPSKAVFFAARKPARPVG
ncbi:class I SAM-dependent methyltransferase [Tropicimonas marinistellae]|uniref:class I SAM-dependent methyltransferase n=1 Tax=Tropicimonas marinistellae TaxID=1739787 RepID=UPI00083320D2|nr:class I SAM-dependent methyltransferase [Tropicimonas marinistellae]